MPSGQRLKEAFVERCPVCGGAGKTLRWKDGGLIPITCPGLCKGVPHKERVKEVKGRIMTHNLTDDFQAKRKSRKESRIEHGRPDAQRNLF